MSRQRRQTIGLVSLVTALLLLVTGCMPEAAVSTKPVKTSDEELLIDRVFGSSNTLTKVDVVKDQYGKYTRTFVGPSDITVVNKSILSEKDANSVAAFAVKFATLEAIDSIALDNGERWDEWVANVAPTYLVSSSIAALVATQDPTQGTGTHDIVLHNNPNSELPLLLRDGGVRVADKRVSDVTVSDYLDSDAIQVTFTVSARFYAPDSSVGPWEHQEAIANMKENTEASPEEIAALEKLINEQGPASLEDDITNVMSGNLSFQYDLVRDGQSWKIANFYSIYELAGFESVDAVQEAYRQDVN